MSVFIVCVVPAIHGDPVARQVWLNLQIRGSFTLHELLLLFVQVDVDDSDVHPRWLGDGEIASTGAHSSCTAHAYSAPEIHLASSSSLLSNYTRSRQSRCDALHLTLINRITEGSYGKIDCSVTGLMTQKEKQAYESIAPVVNMFWVPGTWFISTLDAAVSEGFLTNHPGNKLVMEVHIDSWMTENCQLWFQLLTWAGVPGISCQLWRSLELQLG